MKPKVLGIPLSVPHPPIVPHIPKESLGMISSKTGAEKCESIQALAPGMHTNCNARCPGHS